MNVEKWKVTNFLRRVCEKMNSPGRNFANKAIFYFDLKSTTKRHFIITHENLIKFVQVSIRNAFYNKLTKRDIGGGVPR